MGKRDFRECASRIRVILEHLWKLSAYANALPRGGWKSTILTQRADLEDALTPSLRTMVEDRLEKLHADALKLAAAAFEANEPAASRSTLHCAGAWSKSWANRTTRSAKPAAWRNHLDTMAALS